jgi:hypothetical protein
MAALNINRAGLRRSVNDLLTFLVILSKYPATPSSQHRVYVYARSHMSQARQEAVLSVVTWKLGTDGGVVEPRVVLVLLPTNHHHISLTDWPTRP